MVYIKKRYHLKGAFVSLHDFVPIHRVNDPFVAFERKLHIYPRRMQRSKKINIGWIEFREGCENVTCMSGVLQLQEVECAKLVHASDTKLCAHHENNTVILWAVENEMKTSLSSDNLELRVFALRWPDDEKRAPTPRVQFDKIRGLFLRFFSSKLQWYTAHLFSRFHFSISAKKAYILVHFRP